VEPSRTAGTAYVAFDRHMFDDFRPYLYKTTDYGKTFVALGTTGLPDKGYVHALEEDPRVPPCSTWAPSWASSRATTPGRRG
jgi:hypothetical protein